MRLLEEVVDLLPRDSRASFQLGASLLRRAERRRQILLLRSQNRQIFRGIGVNPEDRVVNDDKVEEEEEQLLSRRSGRGGAATKKMTTTETRSMETRSMGTSSSGERRSGMARRLPWRVIIGRWVGV